MSGSEHIVTGFTSGWDVGMRKRVKLKIPPKFLSWTTIRIKIPLTDTLKSPMQRVWNQGLKISQVKSVMSIKNPGGDV